MPPRSCCPASPGSDRHRGEGQLADPIAWWEALGRPLRRLPRWGAAALLLATVIACGWSAAALDDYRPAARATNVARLDDGARRDFQLYAAINRRVAEGEGYYSAALGEQRASGFPTRPFVTVRPPTLAWSTLALGPVGWRIAAFGLLIAAALGFYAGLEGRANRAERAGAALAVTAAGAAGGIPEVGLSHELVAGLFLSASLALYRADRWWPSLLLAACAVAVREMALAFVLAWAVFALVQRRRRELAAVAGVIALSVAAIALHAQAVAAHRLPGDLVSPGWSAFEGPVLPVFGMVMVTMLQALPAWIAGPLALLPLLGWLALGGRTGLFGALWFSGFAAGAALFARQENFYWLALLIPAYGAGLAFVPRAFGDLTAALRARSPRAEAPGSPTG